MNNDLKKSFEKYIELVKQKLGSKSPKKVGDVDSYGAKCLNGQKGDVKGTQGRS